MERRELTGSFKHATILRHERQPEMTFFSFLTRLRSTTFILLRMFSKAVTTDLEIWEGLLSWHAQCSIPVSVRGSKTSLAQAFYCFKSATSCNFPSFLNLIDPPLPAASKENLLDHSPEARRARAFKILDHGLISPTKLDHSTKGWR